MLSLTFKTPSSLFVDLWSNNQMYKNWHVYKKIYEDLKSTIKKTYGFDLS